MYRSKHNKPILDFILIDTYNLQYIDDTLTKTNTGKYVIQSNSI